MRSWRQLINTNRAGAIENRYLMHNSANQSHVAEDLGLSPAVPLTTLDGGQVGSYALIGSDPNCLRVFQLHGRGDRHEESHAQWSVRGSKPRDGSGAHRVAQASLPPSLSPLYLESPMMRFPRDVHSPKWKLKQEIKGRLLWSHLWL